MIGVKNMNKILSFLVCGLVLLGTVMVLDLTSISGVLELLGITAGLSLLISWKYGIFKRSNFVDLKKSKTISDLTDEDVQKIKETMLKSIQESIIDGKAYPLQVTMTEEFQKHAIKILKENGFEHHEEILVAMTTEFTEYLNRRVTLKNGADEE